MFKKNKDNIFHSFLILSDIKAEVPHHTHHKYHVHKIPEVKIVKVPVVKEVKVLHPYKVPYKLSVPYIIKQDIHTVPVHKHPVYTSHHIHHPPTKIQHHAYDVGHSSFKSHAASNAASNIAPMIVSHTPVGQSSHAMLASFMASQGLGLVPKDVQMISSRDFRPVASSHRHTSVKISDNNNVGFGSQEGTMIDGQGILDDGEVLFDGHQFKAPNEKLTQEASKVGSVKSVKAYPYPFPDPDSGKTPLEFSFGFSPSDSLYDFNTY